ncbi:DNA-binding response regulator [Paramagnetospirillum magneticum]|uniref:CheY-like receiver n=1 Tax=Paramagnetospirillum magneticum (strain ATCC 700264 / AMB-1) TaxID=342108 RepID=Q2W8H9_PARM1|nr:DNA-binding response regulator [Paramagnetospirillum magneticum]BAE49846.1 CheY-like receiver [Paramagnetospirillum magneticum AMB-1]
MSDKARILFVDDDIRVLAALRRSLYPQVARWEMEFQSSPEVAVEAYRAWRPQVVVTDMKMPGMNGLQMVMAMRRIGDTARYIVLTGTADLRTAIDAINQAEIFRFFTKPCPSFLLVEGIQAALAAAAPTSVPAADTLADTALDKLPVAVLVVDSEARILFMNRLGGALSACGDGIVMNARKICRASTPADTVRLHALIESAIRNGDGGVMTLPRSCSSPLSVAVSALESSGDATPKAVLYISDPDNHPIPNAGEVMHLLGITSAEARLTHALARGLSLDEAAEEAGITVGTARGYLKQIFAKTGKTRQAELVRLVMSLPVTLPNGSVPGAK